MSVQDPDSLNSSRVKVLTYFYKSGNEKGKKLAKKGCPACFNMITTKIGRQKFLKEF